MDVPCTEEEEASLTVRGAVNGAVLLSMRSDAISGLTVEELCRRIYIAIEADSSDVDLLLSMGGRTLKDTEQVESLRQDMKPVEVLLIVQVAPQFDQTLPRKEQLRILKRMLFSSKNEKQQLSSELLRKMLHTAVHSVDHHSLFPEVIEIGILPRLVQLGRDSRDLVVQLESLSAMSIISSTSHSQTLVNIGALELFVQKLFSPTQNVRDQAVLAIGNVVSFSVCVRDIALDTGALGGILHELQNMQPASYFEFVGMWHMPRKMQAVWALCNLCKGSPSPRVTQIEPALERFKLLLSEDCDEINMSVLHALSRISKNQMCVVDRLVQQGFGLLVVKELKRGIAPDSSSQIRWRFCSGLLEVALDFLYQLLSGTHTLRQQLVSYNVLEILHTMLDHPEERVRTSACRGISRYFEGSIDDIQLAIDEGSILPLEKMLASDARFPGQPDKVKEIALHALCRGALGGTRKQLDAIIMASIGSMLAMLNCGKNESIIEVLNVLERFLANQEPKHGKESMDSIDTTISPIVSIIWEECFDKISELAQSNLNSPFVSYTAKLILSRLEPIAA